MRRPREPGNDNRQPPLLRRRTKRARIKDAVRVGLDTSRRRRNACRNWINVDARGDLIGGRLAEHFDVHHDYKVPSVGGSPHGSYFHPDNATVQRDIVAAACSEVARELLSDTVIQPAQPSRSPSTAPAKRKSTRKS